MVRLARQELIDLTITKLLVGVSGLGSVISSKVAIFLPFKEPCKEPCEEPCEEPHKEKNMIMIIGRLTLLLNFSGTALVLESDTIKGVVSHVNHDQHTIMVSNEHGRRHTYETLAMALPKTASSNYAYLALALCIATLGTLLGSRRASAGKLSQIQ